MTVPFSVGDFVFGYGRDSGGDQQDLSIDQQEAALRQWCADHGLVLSRMYKDESRKGSSVVGRDGLQAMMHEFRHGCSERGVIVWKYNRFARSVDNAQYFRAEIRTLGYIFHSITDQVPDGPMGRLFEAAIDFKDEQYLIDLSLDIRRGLHDLVRIHGCVPGKPPRGFRREPVSMGTHRDGSPHTAHRWRPDPELAPRVLQAFELRAARVPLSEIMQKTRLFRSINSWRTFFCNRLYTGILDYGDQTFEDYCDPIVPRELWDRVQLVQNGFERRKHSGSAGADHPRRANSRFTLSGLAFCDACGGPLFGHTAVQRNGFALESYACGRHYRNRDCPARRIPRQVLDRAVIATLRDDILRPEVFAAAYDELSRGQSTVLAVQAAHQAQLAGELASIRRQLANVADGIAANGPSRTLNERLTQLEAQRLDLETAVAALNQAAVQPVPAFSAEEFRAMLEQVDLSPPAASESDQRRILRAFIDRISVVRDGKAIRGTIFYYYPPPTLPKARAPGEGAVPLSLVSPGVPRYTHSIQFSASIVFTRRKEGTMPDPCETQRHDCLAAHDEYQRLLVQSKQSGTVDAGTQGSVQVKILKPDLLAQVAKAKDELPAAKKKMDEAAARLEQCQKVNGVF